MFLLWLRDRFENRAADASGPLRIMYRVDGSADLEESTLDHWEGYRGSAPVRIGNGATDQLQLDIYGEAFDAVYHAERKQPLIGKRGWNDLRAIVDWVCENWDQPEEGLWESARRTPSVRVRPDDVLGRARSGDPHGYHELAPRAARSLDRGARCNRRPDRRPRLGRRARKRWCSTTAVTCSTPPSSRHRVCTTSRRPTRSGKARWPAIEKQLVSDSLVYRYNPEASPDGLRGSEGTFSMCTFWYVDALTRTGRLEDARLVFEKMLTYANHLGLFAEEIGQTGEQLGNFPQAFTHLSLITAAVDLDRALDEQRH